MSVCLVVWLSVKLTSGWLCDILTPPSIFIRELISSQLAMKDNSSSSWTSHVMSLLCEHNLPSASILMEDTPEKKKWKEVVNEAVYNKWTQRLKDDAEEKSTLRYLNIQACSTNTLHPVWQDLPCPLSVKWQL